MITLDDVRHSDFADRVLQFLDQRNISNVADVLFVTFNKRTEELQYRIFDHHVVYSKIMWVVTFHPAFFSALWNNDVFLWVFIQSIGIDNGIHTLFESEPMHPDRLALLTSTLHNDVSRGYFLYRVLGFDLIQRYRDVLRFPAGVPYIW